MKPDLAPQAFSYRDRELHASPAVADREALDVDREAYELFQRERRATKRAAGKALLVCSPGGHLAQMLSLRTAWSEFQTTWITLPAADVDHLLGKRPIHFGHGPTNRSIRKLLRNLVFAWRTIRAERPDVILSTGAALAVPFFLIGRLHGSRCVYVESFTRTNGLSTSGWLVYPLANTFFVQWPQLSSRFRKAVHAGSIL